MIMITIGPKQNDKELSNLSIQLPSNGFVVAVSSLFRVIKVAPKINSKFCHCHCHMDY